MNALERLERANPVADEDRLLAAPGAMDAFVSSVKERSGIVEDIHETTMKVEDQPPIQVVGRSGRADEVAVKKPRKRWGLVAAAATVVAVVSVGVVAMLASGDDVAAPVIPDFSQDVILVGEALTAANNSGDVDLYLSLFAADAEVKFFGDTVSAEQREFVLGGWSQTMNERWEYVDCQRTGNAAAAPVLCQVRVTNDWLKLMGEEPDRGRVDIQVVDGKITQWDVFFLASPGDEPRARFEDWTLEHHPVEAALMWENLTDDNGVTFVAPIFTEESARLHLQLGEEYKQQISP